MAFPVSRRVVFFAVCLVPVLAGCPSPDEQKESAEALPFAGEKIRIGVPAGRGFRTAWEGPLNEWAAQTGASYDLNELPAAESSEPFTAFSVEDRQTLAIFPLEQAGGLIAAGDLAPIPESLRRADGEGLQWGDLFAGLASKLASRKGTPMFVPLSCPVLVCYYRQDLLSAAGLSPPQTWDEYQQLVERIEAWAPGLAAVEPWSEEFRATMFLARAVSFAQHPAHYSLFFDIDSAEPLIDSAAFVRALETAKAALARMPPEVWSYGPRDCRNAVVGGSAALAIAFESPGGEITIPESAKGPAVARPADLAIGFIRLPGARETFNPTRRAWEPLAEKGIQQVTLCGFAGLAIAASSRNSDFQTAAGWNALAKLRGPNFDSGFPAGIVGLCRESQMQNPEADVGNNLEGGEPAAYANAVAQSLRDTRLVAELPVEGRSEFRDALARALARALDGSRSPEQALHEAAAQWRTIVERIGPAKVRDDYRVNLGLSPLAVRGDAARNLPNIPLH